VPVIDIATGKASRISLEHTSEPSTAAAEIQDAVEFAQSLGRGIRKRNPEIGAVTRKVRLESKPRGVSHQFDGREWTNKLSQRGSPEHLDAIEMRPFVGGQPAAQPVVTHLFCSMPTVSRGRDGGKF